MEACAHRRRGCSVRRSSDISLCPLTLGRVHRPRGFAPVDDALWSHTCEGPFLVAHTRTGRPHHRIALARRARAHHDGTLSHPYRDIYRALIHHERRRYLRDRDGSASTAVGSKPISYTRSTYSPVSVFIRTTSPASTNIGTSMGVPVSSTTTLVPPWAVLPRVLGGASFTLRSILTGIFTWMGFSSNQRTSTSVFAVMYFAESPIIRSVAARVGRGLLHLEVHFDRNFYLYGLFLEPAHLDLRIGRDEFRRIAHHQICCRACWAGPPSP